MNIKIQMIPLLPPIITVYEVSVIFSVPRHLISCDVSYGLFNDYIFCNVFSDPKEKAKEPDKENNSLPGSRHDAGIVNRVENASHDDIQRSCQQLIDDINAKRKRDTDLLNGTKVFFFALTFLSSFLNT